MLKLFRLLLNNRGEVDAGAKTFTQEDVNRVVETRLAREREKFGDYDELKKFKTEHEQKVSEQAQKDLEDKKQFDQIKGNYEKQITDLKGLVSQKDQVIIDKDISSSLTGAIVGQNAFLEESLALLKPKAKLIDGNVLITLKDANNIDTQYPVEVGVKEFLKSRPHLVKSTARAGGDTGGAGAPGTSGQGTDDLMELNKQFSEAIASGNGKLSSELRLKIQNHPKMARRGRLGI